MVKAYNQSIPSVQYNNYKRIICRLRNVHRSFMFYDTYVYGSGLINKVRCSKFRIDKQWR